MIGDYFKLALGSITHRKLRSWLTMVGIFIGVMAVVALISLGEGLQNTVNEQFEKVGSNRIVITPGGGGGESAMMSMAMGLSEVKLTEHDVDIVNGVRGVEYAAGVITRSVNVEYAGERKYLMMACIPTDDDALSILKNIDYFMVEEGKMLQKGDKYKVVVGKELTGDFFDKEIRLNDRIDIEEQSFTVIGIFKKSGNPVHDQKVTLTKEMCKEMFNMTDEVTMIMTTVKKGFNTTQVAEEIKDKLRKDHNVKENEEDFTVTTPEDIMRTVLSVINLVQVVLTGIAAISLIVGGIGIMNTMYTAVLERTKEIGIMKAVGARNSDILSLFMVEAGLLGTIGGVIGTVLGLGIAKLVEQLALYSGLELLKIQVSPALLVGALGFSFIVGSISGIMPALRAAKMEPVEALRK